MRKLMEAVKQLDEGIDDDVRNKVGSRKPGHGMQSTYDENAVVDAIEQVKDAIFAVGVAAGRTAAQQMIDRDIHDGDPYDMGNKTFDEIVKRFTSEVTRVAAKKADTDVGKHSNPGLGNKAPGGNLLSPDVDYQ